MSIISEIGRKDLKVRVFIWSVYIVLILGAITMIYPFWLMIAGSSKSNVDSPESEMIPRFLVDNTAFYRKSAEGFFNEYQDQMQMVYDINNITFRSLNTPETINDKLITEWKNFQKENDLPFYYYDLAFLSCERSKSSQPELLRKFKIELKKEFKNSCDAMNLALKCNFVSWNTVTLRPGKYVTRRARPGMDEYNLKFRAFKEKQPIEYRYYFCPEGFYKTTYLKAQYTKNIFSYNKANGTKYQSWNEVYLPRRYPAGKEYTDQQRKDWLIYVRSILNLFWIRADKKAEPLYQKYLAAKYDNKINALNKLYETSYKLFSDIRIIENPPFEGVCLSDWDSFLQGWNDQESGKYYILPKEMIYIHSIEFMFRDYLIKKYGSLEKVNAAVNAEYQTTLAIYPPQDGCVYRYVEENKASLKWEFLIRNFITVFEYVVLQGRGILNTVIYCSLAILGTLLINPLAAYALSRYKLPATYKILLFLMLTMAFPPMVTSIPTFLMLREFNLLNTFWALILPGLANGYSIFLLKGFFDSLPQELYESAELDGAGEFRIFWQITMSLSKPILAVISLQAFNLAYANFMMALLYCQDEKMWTLMPWLYQLQQRSCQGVVFTSLLIAAIPTFIIFVFCQNIIMRGIVVPVEK